MRKRKDVNTSEKFMSFRFDILVKLRDIAVITVKLQDM